MFHPDKNPEDPEAASARFLDVSEAYKILANDDLRRRYDETGDPGVDRGFDRGGGFSRGARASAGPAGDSRRFDRAWSFRYDRRDVGADGFARGRWTHKTTGEEVDGERDVRGGNDGGRSARGTRVGENTRAWRAPAAPRRGRRREGSRRASSVAS